MYVDKVTELVIWSLCELNLQKPDLNLEGKSYKIDCPQHLNNVNKAVLIIIDTDTHRMTLIL